MKEANVLVERRLKTYNRARVLSALQYGLLARVARMLVALTYEKEKPDEKHRT